MGTKNTLFRCFARGSRMLLHRRAAAVPSITSRMRRKACSSGFSISGQAITTQMKTMAARPEASGLRMSTAVCRAISVPRPISGYRTKRCVPAAGNRLMASRNKKPHTAPMAVPHRRLNPLSRVSRTQDCRQMMAVIAASAGMLPP